jgi:hypothetical protein
MRILSLALLLICGSGQAALGQDFYDVSTVHTIEIVFTQSNWDHILDSLFESEERLVGTVTIDGVQFDSVGIRYKGFSTYSPSRVKNPLNIKLDYIIDDQEIQGYGTLKLANVWFDPSFVREVLGYEIARKYMPGSGANYANVYINGALMGLYVSVQDVDKLYMRTFFHSDENARFKGETSGQPQTYVVWGYEGADSTTYTDTYEIESDAGWSDLIHFVDTLNNYTSAVEKVLDVDRHLWMIAYDNLLVNLDAPINFAHNYYLYRDDSYRFNPIIWDLNMNFGGFSSLIGGPNLSISQMQQLTPFLNETNSNYPIIKKILPTSNYKKKYIAHMKTIIAENFANNWYHTRALELQDIVDSYVQADPNKFSTYANFINNVTSAVGQTPGIVQLMAARVTYLNNLSQFQAVAPTITAISHSPSEVPANASFWINATVTNATAVTFAYRDELVGPFTNAPMLDDGAHNDGAAGDGTYGASVQAGVSDIHYYIYAENASAGKFEPQRAEFEDSTLAVIASLSCPVVINEFMADNDSIQADQDGEYEDWIELYNPSADAISLSGFHLSDKTSNPGKWTFPDISIAPYGYLIVWADEDVAQVGLHANFALSASGEAVLLSDADTVIVDSISYGAQSTDISMGRCPNGSGAFITMTPTFAQQNTCSSVPCPVVINEFLADNASIQADQDNEYDDWIELHNPTGSAVSLNGFHLSDNPANPSKWTFPDTSIAAYGYLIIWADEDDAQVGLHAGFKLSASGESVLLADPDTAIVDSTTYGAQTADISAGRCPNGTGAFDDMTPTFGQPNDCSSSSPLVINEFLADNGSIQPDQDGEYDDWIELYNPTASGISLNGFHLSDVPTNPAKWSFPDTSIAAFEHLIIWADEDDGQVGLHANFKLSASGESALLADPDTAIVDSVTFGAQTEDISVGRCPDGSGAFTTMAPSFAQQNTCTFICGDANGSGGDPAVDIDDIVFLINYVFASGTSPDPLEAGDANCSGGDVPIDIDDIVYLINYVFGGGPAPCDPDGSGVPDC